MKKAIKILLIGSAGIVVAAAAAALICFKFFYFPKIDGTVRTDGVSAKVDIYRDKYGIPHIIASNDRDAFYGLGYAMAQYRPLQLEIYRRAANATLSEALPGDEMIRMDKLSRFIQFRELGEKAFNNMDAESQGYVVAFVNGINDAQAALSGGPLPRPLTMLAFGGRPGKWKTADPLAIGLMAAWLRTGNYGSEYLFAKIEKKLGKERAAELLPFIPPPSDSYVDALRDSGLLAAGDSMRRLLGAGTGCSAWCVAAAKSDSGESMLVYNAHTGDLRVPAEHFLVHLKGGPRLDMAGAAITGVPGFFAGSNGKIAWGLTQNDSDVTDLYREKINPQNPSQYLYLGKWNNFAVREEKICRKSQPGKTCESMPVRSTVHGPVISDLMPDYKSKDEVLSVQWTGFQPDITFSGYVKLAQSQNWEDFRAALDKLDISANHFIFADSEGRIGYQLGGMLPLRKPGKTPSQTPAEGWNDDDIWPRRLSVDEKPHMFNPQEGMIASANNRPFKIDGPNFIGAEFFPPQRRDRIYEVLASRKKFSAQQMYDTQKDVFNPAAKQILPFILADLSTSNAPDHKWLKNELEKWDMNMTTASRPALLFEAVFSFMQRETFPDELGDELAAQYIGNDQVFRARFFKLLEDPNNHWFDDTRTKKTEKRADITLRAADIALKYIAEKLGPDRNKWNWGALHTLTIRHYAEGITKRMNINYGPVPGSNDTMNRFGYSAGAPFGVSVISDVRMFVDFNDPKHVKAAIHTGQSDWWGSANYADQTPLLVNAELISIPLDLDEAKKQSVAHMVLEPAK